MVQGGVRLYYIPSLVCLKNKTLHTLEVDPCEAERLESSQEYNKVYCEAVAGYTGDATLYVGIIRRQHLSESAWISIMNIIFMIDTAFTC